MAVVIPPEYVKEKNLKVGYIISFEVYKIDSKKILQNSGMMKQILESEKNIAKGKIKKLKL